MAGLTVLDASVLIAHFDDTDPHTDDARTILAAAERLGASTITLAECLVGAAAANRLQEQIQAITALEIVEIGVPQDSAAALAQLRVETGLRMPACCVLLAAQLAGADALATRDDRLRRAASTRGLRTP